MAFPSASLRGHTPGQNEHLLRLCVYEFDSAAHTIHWTLDKTAPGNTVVDLDGGYEAVALSPAETLVVYRAWVDSGRSVPRFIQDYVSRRSIPNSLRAIKMRVESGGTYRKK